MTTSTIPEPNTTVRTAINVRVTHPDYGPGLLKSMKPDGGCGVVWDDGERRPFISRDDLTRTADTWDQADDATRAAEDAEAAAWEGSHPRRNGVEHELKRMREHAEALAIFKHEQAAAEGIPPFDAGTLDEVLARPEEPAHRAEGIIPAEAGTLIVAQRKTGKTTLQLNLARCLLTGGDFLGRFPVQPVTGRIAFLNFEVSAAQVARWAHEVGIPGDRLFLVNLRGRRNPLSNPRDRDALATRLRDLDVESLFVDPFGRAYSGTNQNDPGEVGAWLADLDRFARGDVGARDIFLAAHAGWDGERTRGSTALEDWADSIITLVREKENQTARYLRAEGRDVHIAEDALDFDETTRTLTLAGAGSRKNAARTRQVDALLPTVLDLLAATPSMSGNQLDQAIRALIDSGDLDAKLSKGDGTKAAQILERRSLVGSKARPGGGRLFSLLTNPTSLTSPNFPQTSPEGSEATSPTSLIGGRSQPGNSDATTSPTARHSDQQEQT